MSKTGDSPAASEIVIIRRRAGDDMAATKGGAWKIAYADFVTAMMAFFLVMWLINASNEATRAQVASYFNPIKLTDSSTAERGIRDRKERKSTESSEGDAAKTSDEDVKHEAEIMNDPDSTLERIAAGSSGIPAHRGTEPSKSEELSGSTRTSEMAAPGIGDPFDPRSWGATKRLPSLPPAESPVDGKGDSALQNGKSAAASPVKDDNNDLSVDPSETAQVGPSSDTSVGDRPMAATDDKTVVQAELQLGNGTNTVLKEELASGIAREIAAQLGGGLDGLPESVEVTVVDDGILISLTDKAGFGMFKVGSAEPEPQLLDLVSAIGTALTGHEGFIVVRGHTDSRPFRNKKYDNWQLSTARAHFAQYMLVRSGLDEHRIRRIEGMADRSPKVPGDPDAAANRRIEILLGTDRRMP